MIKLFKIIYSLAVMIIGIVAGVSWLIFCFGSVLGVILLLIFAPPLLFAPFGITIYGYALLINALSDLD